MASLRCRSPALLLVTICVAYATAATAAGPPASTTSATGVFRTQLQACAMAHNICSGPGLHRDDSGSC